MVYTDGVHLVAESEAELHAFARGIGLKSEWFQNRSRLPHYDLMGCKCSLAARAGAQVITPRDIVRLHQEGRIP